ncbi:MAG: two-component sensor histidine kinase [Acidimicrobiia bacterium]|nr:two-component sensor histidine kinase [Acidimicrobiia bacterium]
MGGAIAAGLLASAFVALSVWVVGSRRSVARRLGVLAARLGDGEVVERPRLEASVTALERAADEASIRVDRSTSAAERLAQALDALHQGVVLCDEEGHIVYRNLLAESFAGARHAEALAEQAIGEVLKAAALDGEPHTRSVDLYGPPRRNLQISAVPLSDGARSVGGVAVIEDVSDRKRLEAVRRDFVANVSHELKTPVGALGLLAETLADEEDAAVIRRLAHRMQAEAIRVGRIIHDLLDLSRLESEESPEREPVGVHLMVGQAVEQVRAAAEGRGVDLDVAEIPRRITVPGDRRQLVSAVYNLLDNAVKYSEPGSAVHLRCATNGDAVELAVQDHGIGIPSRDYERIFERFYRVDRARSRETGGTGLGLAIVRHVATNHGGRVSVTSREGEGSTFVLRLPAGPGPVAVSGWTDAEAG